MSIAPKDSDAYQSMQNQLNGVRMSGAAYFELGESESRYELVDGVLLMSPSPTPLHQAVAWELSMQIGTFLRQNPTLGRAFYELDVALPARAGRGDLIYRPDLIFLSAKKAAQVKSRIDVIPDLVVEISSAATRKLDQQTKRDDYERCGVGEYWLTDIETASYTFLRMTDSSYREQSVKRDVFESTAIPGFVLDLLSLNSVMNSSS